MPTTRTEGLLAVSRSPLESTLLQEVGSLSTPTAFSPGSASVPLEGEPSPVLSPASAGSSSDPDDSSKPGSSDLAPVSSSPPALPTSSSPGSVSKPETGQRSPAPLH